MKSFNIYYLDPVYFQNKNDQTKLADWLIKIGLLLLFGGMLYWQLFMKNDIRQLVSTFQTQLSERSIWWMILMIALMPLNWLLETYKWKKLLPENISLSMGQALKAIFGGITLSILTPNRIGEYGGRVLFVRPENQWEAVIATVVGSFSQNLANILFGSIGLLFLVKGTSLQEFHWAWAVGLFTLLFMLFWLYLNIHWVNALLNKVKLPVFIEKRKHHLLLLKSYSRSLLMGAFSLSVLRYLVFSIQFMMILHFFGLDISLLKVWLGVTVIYLFHTGIPLPPFVDVLARSEIALIIWQSDSPNELSILLASFGIWIINLVIPALIGLVAIERINVLKALGYGKEKPS